VEVCELNSGFVYMDQHCNHCEMNTGFSNYNVTSVVKAVVIGSVNLLAKVIFAVLDI